MLLSAAALVATCTPASGLHSSSSTTSSNWYLLFGSALRRRTARSAELRPPSPMAELPPVSGPTKAILTTSFARTAGLANARNVAAPAATAAEGQRRYMGDLQRRRQGAVRQAQHLEPEKTQTGFALPPVVRKTLWIPAPHPPQPLPAPREGLLLRPAHTAGPA